MHGDGGWRVSCRGRSTRRCTSCPAFLGRLRSAVFCCRSHHVLHVPLAVVLLLSHCRPSVKRIHAIVQSGAFHSALHFLILQPPLTADTLAFSLHNLVHPLCLPFPSISPFVLRTPCHHAQRHSSRRCIGQKGGPDSLPTCRLR